MNERGRKVQGATLCLTALLFLGGGLAGCQGKCVKLDEDINVDTLSYEFSECTRGASERAVLCERDGQTRTFECTCTEAGKETASFETQGPAPGVMSNMVVSYETLDGGCEWTDLAPFLGSR